MPFRVLGEKIDKRFDTIEEEIEQMQDTIKEFQESGTTAVPYTEEEVINAVNELWQ